MCLVLQHDVARRPTNGWQLVEWEVFIVHWHRSKHSTVGCSVVCVTYWQWLCDLELLHTRLPLFHVVKTVLITHTHLHLYLVTVSLNVFCVWLYLTDKLVVICGECPVVIKCTWSDYCCESFVVSSLPLISNYLLLAFSCRLVILDVCTVTHVCF